MKKYLIILLALFMATPCLGYPRAANARTTFRNGYAWSGHPSKDLATQWAQAIEGLAETGGAIGTGSVWFVDSGVSASGSGTSWIDAVSTLDAVFALITADGGASRGDYVMVAEGHSESSASTIFDADVIGVTVIGKGSGSLKPTFIAQGVATPTIIGADNVTLINLRISPGTDTSVQKALLDIEAGSDNAHIIGCDFGFPESSGDEFGFAIRINACTGTVVERCFIDGGEETAVAAIAMDGSDLTLIGNNTVIGDYSVANIHSATTTNHRIIIEDNWLWNGVNSGLNAKPVISLLSTDDGLTRRNYAACNVATVAAAFVGTQMQNFGNYYNEDAGGGTTALALDVGSTTSQSVLVSGDD